MSSVEKGLVVLVEQVNHELSMCPCCQEGQWYSGVYSTNRNTGHGNVKKNFAVRVAICQEETAQLWQL